LLGVGGHKSAHVGVGYQSFWGAETVAHGAGEFVSDSCGLRIGAGLMGGGGGGRRERELSSKRAAKEVRSARGSFSCAILRSRATRSGSKATVYLRFIFITVDADKKGATMQDILGFILGVIVFVVLFVGLFS